MPAPLMLARSTRRLAVILVAGLIALIAGLAPATNAYASPSPQEIQSQIDQLWAQLEPLINKYDELHDQLSQNQAKQAGMTQQLQPLQMKVDLAMSRVGAISAQAYMYGPGSHAASLLTAGSPDALLDQMATLDQLARKQQQTVNATKDQIDEYNKQKAPLDQLVAQQKQQDAAMAAQRQQIQGQIDRLQQLRSQATGLPPQATPNPNQACPVSAASGAAAKAVAYACAKRGDKYVFGAVGPTQFDCSGLTLAAWGAAGVSLYHYTGTQQKQTTSISAGMLKPGDLVFWGQPAYHVAIYVGGGYVVHAPNALETVREVPMTSIGKPSTYGRPNA